MTREREMNRKIWIVEGTSGEYEDKREWPAAFYYDEKLADAHAIKAQARARKIHKLVSPCTDCFMNSPESTCSNGHAKLKNNWDKSDLYYIDLEKVEYYSYSVQLGSLKDTEYFKDQRKKRIKI